MCGPHSVPIVGAVLGNLWTNVLKLEPAEPPGGLVKRDAGPSGVPGSVDLGRARERAFLTSPR